MLVDDIRKRIIKDMFKRKMWAAKHTNIDNLHKSIPSHLKGLAKKVAKDLIKEELIITKPTSYGLEVSLNPRRKNEILEILENS